MPGLSETGDAEHHTLKAAGGDDLCGYEGMIFILRT
jgi:hypothetical protein